MKKTLIVVSAAALVIGIGSAAYADDHDKKVSVDVDKKEHVDKKRTYAHEKMSELNRAAHDKMCKGKHGTITDKTANSLSIDGKKYAFVIDTPVNKQEEPLLPKTSKVGDRVCFTTMKAADGTQQLDKLMAIDRQADDKVRVREKVDDDTEVEIKADDKDNDVEIKASDDKLKVKSDDNKIEVK